MTQDEIIEMARQAAKGKPFFGFFPQLDIGLLETFAKLVAAKEREAIWNIIFEYAGRDDLTPEDESLLKHLADLIKARGET